MKKKIRLVLLLACIAVFLYSSYQVFTIYFQYKEVEEETEELIVDYTKGEKEEKKVNFEDLAKLNSDVIGWISIEDTKINEPILKGKNNNSYIHTNVKKKYSFAGEIFMEELNNKDFNDPFTILYGHHMKNGSKFAHIKKFLKKDFFDSHKEFYIYLTDGTVRTYSIIGVAQITTESHLYSVGGSQENYLKEIKKVSKYKRDVPSGDGSIVMLSTCTHATGNGRNVLFAKCISETKK